MSSDITIIYSGPMGQVDVVKAILEAEGIECFYGHESIGGFIPDMVKSLYINQTDFEKASMLIASMEEEKAEPEIEVQDPVVEPESKNPIASVDSILAGITDPSRKSKGQYGNFLFMLVSIVLFFSLSLFGNSVLDIVFLMIVLLVHELGHVAGMRLFRYKNVQILFIPFFGAAASGTHGEKNGLKESIISFMGPVPGLLIALILMIVTKNSNPYLKQLCIISVFLNGFNLLPIFPLDGGRILDALIFKRNRYLQAAYKLLAAAVIFVLAYAMKSYAFALLGLIVLISIKSSFLKAKIAHALKSKHGDTLVLDTDNVKFRDTVSVIYDAIKSENRKYLIKNIATSTVQDVLDLIRYRAPSLPATVLLCAMYFIMVSFSLFAVGVVSVLK